MENIEITRVTPAEIKLLQTISRQTFSETFSAANSSEDMQKYLAGAFSVEKLTAELNDKNTEFYFARLHNQVIGYLKINTGASQTELHDENALEIERIYVLQQYHGKAVGQLLYEKAFLLARQIKARYVWLGVWEENHRAISFYKKNGFVAFSTHVFMLGNDAQTDIIMKLDIAGKDEVLFLPYFCGRLAWFLLQQN